MNNPESKILAFDITHPEPDPEKNRSQVYQIPRERPLAYSVEIPRGKYTTKSLTNYINQKLPGEYKVDFDEITCRFQIYYVSSRGLTPEGVISLNEKSNVDFLMGFEYDPKITSKDGILEAKNPSSLLDPVTFSISLGDRNVETTGSLYVDLNFHCDIHSQFLQNCLTVYGHMNQMMDLRPKFIPVATTLLSSVMDR